MATVKVIFIYSGFFTGALTCEQHFNAAVTESDLSFLYTLLIYF